MFILQKSSRIHLIILQSTTLKLIYKSLSKQITFTAYF